MARKYELKRRAERLAETRRRIVQAAVDLHTTQGPARTTIAGIARRAGVQRHTVYAHFPDDRTLFAACSEHWRRANPFPDAAAWESIDDPERRLQTALTDVYGWYAAVEPALALFARDASVVPVQQELTAAFAANLASIADLLAAAFPRPKAVRAAIGHALEFETWRSLVRRQGVSPDAAVDLMLRLAASN